jgi:hypothetical protein
MVQGIVGAGKKQWQDGIFCHDCCNGSCGLLSFLPACYLVGILK